MQPVKHSVNMVQDGPYMPDSCVSTAWSM